MTLTAKREAYCKHYALEEKTQYESYCLAYPKQAKNSSRKVLDNKASELMKNGEIMVRILSLKTELDTKTIDNIVITKVKLLEELESIKKSSFDKDNKIAIDCIKEQGKLEGFYVDKIDMKSQFSIVQGMRDFKNSQNRARDKKLEELTEKPQE